MANQTTSIDYKHPYVILTWQHRPSGGSWQDATLLSGYVGGQGTKTLELSGATEAETGHLQCALTIPDGRITYSDLATLSATAEAPNITVGISAQTPYEGESATYGPITVTGSPTPTLLWEAETADGNNTWADADTVFGADGSGQGTDTYVIANAVPADNRDIRVTATNTVDSDVSQAALTVTPTLAFTTDPQDKTVLETATGTPEYLIDFTLKDRGAWTHTRSSDATAPDESGVIQTYTTDQPAWYRDQGLQLEDAATNSATYSNDIGAQGAAHDDATPFYDGENGPDGRASTRAVCTVNTSRHYISTATYSGNPTSNAYTAFFKHVDHQWVRVFRATTGAWVNFDILNGVIGLSGATVRSPFTNITMEDAGNGWWKTTFINEDASNAAIRFYFSNGNTTDVDETWNPGAPIEFLVSVHDAVSNDLFPTSHIYTSGATYTRAATNCAATFAELGDPLPAGGFTNDFCGQIVVVLQQDWDGVAKWNRLFEINIGTGTTNYMYAAKGNFGEIHAEVAIDGVLYPLTVGFTGVTGDTVDIRFKKDATGGFTFWANGTKGNSATATGAYTAGITDIDLLQGRFATQRINGIVSKVRIVPEALTDEEIEAWT